MTPLSFFVPGTPATGGSKKFVGFAKSTGRAILIDDAGERNKNWRAVVAAYGAKAMEGREVLHCALQVRFEFLIKRPKSHFGKRGELRPDAPIYSTTRPDALKLARSTEDALTGIVWRDDAQTAMLSSVKFYSANGETGCEITICELVNSRQAMQLELMKVKTK